jgi:hypothetical protein
VYGHPEEFRKPQERAAAAPPKDPSVDRALKRGVAKAAGRGDSDAVEAALREYLLGERAPPAPGPAAAPAPQTDAHPHADEGSAPGAEGAKGEGVQDESPCATPCPTPVPERGAKERLEELRDAGVGPHLEPIRSTFVPASFFRGGGSEKPAMDEEDGSGPMEEGVVAPMMYLAWEPCVEEVREGVPLEEVAALARRADELDVERRRLMYELRRVVAYAAEMKHEVMEMRGRMEDLEDRNERLSMALNGVMAEALEREKSRRMAEAREVDMRNALLGMQAQLRESEEARRRADERVDALLETLSHASDHHKGGRRRH